MTKRTARGPVKRVTDAEPGADRQPMDYLSCLRRFVTRRCESREFEQEEGEEEIERSMERPE